MNCGSFNLLILETEVFLKKYGKSIFEGNLKVDRGEKRTGRKPAIIVYIWQFAVKIF
jgi:hypothetical protein